MNKGENLPRLVEVMQRLLAPDGCPWDREQTLDTLKPYVIEEAHEVVEAIESGDPNALRDELGDLLLQVVFQAELARAQGWFGPNDVVDAICEKLVRRHPHVFADVSVEGSEEVVKNWEQIKRAEKGDRGALAGVPKSLPALLRAVRVAEKASAVGYDWPSAEGPRKKVDEELGEFDEACANADATQMEEELGDLLFSICNVARKRNLDPEAALRGTLRRFTSRFEFAERAAKAAGRKLEEFSEAELDELWMQAKRSP